VSRQEYTMSQSQLDVILDASKPVPWFAPGGVWPKSPRENAEAAWRVLGEEMGFQWDTARPVPGKSQLVFTAEPK